MGDRLVAWTTHSTLGMTTKQRYDGNIGVDVLKRSGIPPACSDLGGAVLNHHVATAAPTPGKARMGWNLDGCEFSAGTVRLQVTTCMCLTNDRSSGILGLVHWGCGVERFGADSSTLWKEHP